MPRPQTNLDAWQDTIEARITEGQTQYEILTWLAGEGVRVSRGTLRSILRLWGIESDRSRLRNHRQDPSVPTAIHDLWS